MAEARATALKEGRACPQGGQGHNGSLHAHAPTHGDGGGLMQQYKQALRLPSRHGHGHGRGQVGRVGDGRSHGYTGSSTKGNGRGQHSSHPSPSSGAQAKNRGSGSRSGRGGGASGGRKGKSACSPLHFLTSSASPWFVRGEGYFEKGFR